jgi:hypothetical protein
MNAVAYLFERSEIPPLAVQKIFLYSLDSISLRKKFGHGTTGYAVELLANWLTDFNEKKFRVEAEVLKGEQVHLRSGNRISKCLNEGGVCLLSVTHFKGHRHFILAIGNEKGFITAFDPYPKKASVLHKGFKFIEARALHQPNLRISTAWLDRTSSKLPFRFGVTEDRQCVLFNRAKA